MGVVGMGDNKIWIYLWEIKSSFDFSQLSVQLQFVFGLHHNIKRPPLIVMKE